MEQILAMYDVRGIQDYIFRTPKVKEAVGASKIIENIFEDSLDDAVRQYNSRKDRTSVTYDREWCTADGVKEYKSADSDIQVIYIGGGSACVLFSSNGLAVEITKLMSEYVIRSTYSLQLAVAYVEKSDNYGKDYAELTRRMEDVKESMNVSRPVGTLPVMKIELQTGYPLEYAEDQNLLLEAKSKETAIKYEKGWEIRRQSEKSTRILDSYITKKEVDSTLAVVHIDGNSMGSRIVRLVEGIDDYPTAVNRMRQVSYNIDHSYKKTFHEMEEFFNSTAGSNKAFKDKEVKDRFVAGILVAGDDVTYVCNGMVAFSSVEYFVKKINALGMCGANATEDIANYGFTVCAGVAFINSHFPFNIGYEVAEACCRSAKEEAKNSKNIEGGRIGNWMDFHICKNIQALNLKRVRAREYITPQGEILNIRPYYISTDQDPKGPVSQRLAHSNKSLESFLKNVEWLRDPEKLPRSQAQQLRNTYPLGRQQMMVLLSFLKSRNRKLPNGDKLYFVLKNGQNVAALYDALEFVDDYVNIFESEGEENDEASD